MNAIATSILCTILAVSTAGCMAPPKDLDTSLVRQSAQDRYVVTLVPPSVPPAINAMHTWQVKLATPDGAPVNQASITVDGGMPQHGHGLPTQPLVRRELAGGTYLIEGMKFSMTGWWEIKLAINASRGADRVTFNTVVREPNQTSWTADESSVISSLRLGALAPPPLDPSNAVDGQAQAVQLGRQLFGDVRLSSNGKVSCASCHSPDKQFQDGLPVSRGVGTGSRRAMPVVGVGHSPWLFWDGRKDSAWAQALGPLEDGVEHGGNRTRYARLIQSHYKPEYQALFGPLPSLEDAPQDAGPQGNAAERAAWDALPRERRDEISRVFANMGKAIAAYEKTLAYGEARFDKYANAVAARDRSGQSVLTPQEQNGLRLFVGKAQCVTCHNGPMFTDQAFHNTGVPQRDPNKPDRGRAAALLKVKQDEFNCLGQFSDAKAEACQELAFMTTDAAGLEAAFKTPSLRNAALRPPYMHAGQFSSLEEVILHYVKAPAATVGHSELAHGKPGHTERRPIQLSDQEIKDVALFLGTLSGPIVERAPR